MHAASVRGSVCLRVALQPLCYTSWEVCTITNSTVIPFSVEDSSGARCSKPSFIVLPFLARYINLFISFLLSFIPPSLGIIMTAVADLDRETQDRYELVVKATDMAGQMGGLSGSTTVTIVITDVNDNPPRFTQSESPAHSHRCFPTWDRVLGAAQHLGNGKVEGGAKSSVCSGKRALKIGYPGNMDNEEKDHKRPREPEVTWAGMTHFAATWLLTTRFRCISLWMSLWA